jgi:hypothetical protein
MKETMTIIYRLSGQMIQGISEKMNIAALPDRFFIWIAGEKICSKS